MINLATTALRRVTVVVTAVVVLLTVSGLGADSADASVPYGSSTAVGSAVCYDNMVDVSAPVDGQSWTYLRFYRFDGTEWVKYSEGRFHGPIVSGAVVYNDADGVFMAPLDQYIHVQMWGFYPGRGWVRYPVAHAYQLGPSSNPAYCRA